ncbi:MAG: hypothetical protein QOF95_1695, partial [Pseudonocardiales bacterium]|nr:hypothetical protein [Pseudonocardiales bacterium]
VLEHAGLITRSRAAQQRPARLRAAPLGEVTDWLETYRQQWEDRLDRLAEHLKESES